MYVCIYIYDICSYVPSMYVCQFHILQVIYRLNLWIAQNSAITALQMAIQSLQVAAEPSRYTHEIKESNGCRDYSCMFKTNRNLNAHRGVQLRDHQRDNFTDHICWIFYFVLILRITFWACLMRVYTRAISSE